uniref:Chitin-binding type-2 domain-containing protein n=1 Tax=Daphnia galeata TaxID=27404 RepID=A0A8J2WMQ8_9CRUS|nr:unnamed protein product [Daphnia galeata]
MKFLALSVFLLIAVAHVSFAAVSGRGPGGPGGEPPVFDCTGKVGFYADLWKNCEVYYQCLEDGAKLTFGCPSQPSQTYFNEGITECVQSYKCPDPQPI